MAYRDDEHALQAKKEQLESDRARIEEHKRAFANLADEEARIHRELAEVETRLAKRNKSLPLLGEIRVASPCNADWNSMTGDAQTRFCAQCAKNVYNLSAMTTQQAEALLREKEGKLCVRYYQRKDGTVLTADCSVGLRKKRVKTVAFVAAFGAAAGGAYLAQPMQGEIEAVDTRMGKLEAFDFGPMDQTQSEVNKVSGQIVEEIDKSPLRQAMDCGLGEEDCIDRALFPQAKDAPTAAPVDTSAKAPKATPGVPPKKQNAR